MKPSHKRLAQKRFALQGLAAAALASLGGFAGTAVAQEAPKSIRIG